MDDFIKRKAAVADLRSYAERKAQVNGVEYANGILAAACRLEDNPPAADVRPRGKWKHVSWHKDESYQEGGYWISRCTNCSMPYHSETPFCPHCGADMRGGEHDG